MPLRHLYSLAWLLATPLVIAYLLWRSIRQPAYRSHWGERFGLHRARVGHRPLIWIHAVSVGETRAAQPLVRELANRHPQAAFLMTGMTPTGRDTARELYAPLLGDRFHQAYLPYDHPWAMRRFLRAWRPQLGLLMETELWPNLMAVATDQQVPLALINARLSERSLARGLKQSALIVPAARQLACVLAQSPADAQRMARLGRPADAVTGNLKFDNAPDLALQALGRDWRARVGRPVVLAASTREGEEPLIWAAWRQALGQGIDPAGQSPLLAIVPRHPQRFEGVASEARAAGFRVLRRAALDDPAIDWQAADVLVGDSMGEMDAWYALAQVTLMGGSFLPFGSQNLIEACAAGCPVILGPSTFNFAEAATDACRAGAAMGVADPHAAVEMALNVLTDSAQATRMGAAGAGFAAEHRGATQRTVMALAPWLSRLQAPARET